MAGAGSGMTGPGSGMANGCTIYGAGSIVSPHLRERAKLKVEVWPSGCARVSTVCNKVARVHDRANRQRGRLLQVIVNRVHVVVMPDNQRHPTGSAVALMCDRAGCGCGQSRPHWHRHVNAVVKRALSTNRMHPWPVG
jgi:hypothetical protein